jgi:hypothetical protein
MRKRVFIAVSILVLSLLVMLQGFLVSDANPVPWPSTPNQEKPTLTIKTPQNYTTYNDSTVHFNFTVTAPISWNKIQHMFEWIYNVGKIASVNQYLDGKLINGNLTDYSRIYISGSSYSVKLNQTSPGQHSLNVTVQSYTYYREPIYGNSSIPSGIIDEYIINGVTVQQVIYQYPIVVSDIVYFTVEQPTSTQSAYSADTDYFLNQTSLISIAIVIVIVAVASIALVYFKRRKSKIA